MIPFFSKVLSIASNPPNNLPLSNRSVSVKACAWDFNSSIERLLLSGSARCRATSIANGARYGIGKYFVSC